MLQAGTEMCQRFFLLVPVCLERRKGTDLRRWAVEEEWFSLFPANSGRGDSPVPEPQGWHGFSASSLALFFFSAKYSFSGTDLSSEGQQAETRNKASSLCFWPIAKWDHWSSEGNLNWWTSVSVLNTPVLPSAASFHSLCVINMLQNKKSQVKVILMAGKLATGVGISVRAGSEVVPRPWGVKHL